MENKLTISKLINDLNVLSKLGETTALRSVVEYAAIPVLESKYGKASNFSIIANDKGDFEIIREYTVVDKDHYNVCNEISINDPKINPEDEYEVGEIFTEVVDLSNLSNSEIMTIKYRINKEIINLTLDYVKKKYSHLLGKIIRFIISGIGKSDYKLTDSDGNEFTLPYTEKVPGEQLSIGDEVYALVTEIGLTNKVTRKSKEFVNKLLEEFSDHVLDCIVVNSTRKAGVQSKISIKCNFKPGLFDDIKYLSTMMSQELNKEQVDIVIYSSNNDKYLKNCFYNVWLIDAWVSGDEGNLLVDKNQLPYAIGKSGTNIKLIESLIGMHINVHVSEVPKTEDIELSEYSDEVSNKLIDKLDGLNITTARELMKYDVFKLPKFINKAELHKLLDLIHEDFISGDKED